MLFSNVSINVTLLTMCHTGLQLTLFISKQTSMKAMNSGVTTIVGMH